MATQLSKTVDEATDQLVSLVEQAQDAATSVVSNISEVVANYLPSLGIGEAVLSPAEAVETSYKVGDKFIDAGRKAALGFVTAVSPVTDKLIGTKKPAAKSVSKSA